MSLHTMYMVIPCRDRSRFTEWLDANEERNHADDNDRDAATVLEAVDKDDTICYMPSYPVIMLGALAPKPGVTPFQVTHALKALVHAAGLLAATNGARELVFWGTDEATCKVAEYVGFEKVEMPMYRLRVPK